MKAIPILMCLTTLAAASGCGHEDAGPADRSGPAVQQGRDAAGPAPVRAEAPRPSPAPAAATPAGVERVGVAEARRRVQGGEALLVCAYEDEGRFEAMHLEGAISFATLEQRLPSLDRRTEIIFYCA
jgi:hypothetical protein